MTMLHLLRHDMRAHASLLLAWSALVLAHPLVALLPSREGPPGPLMLLAFVLVFARFALGAVVLGTIVQADSPIDDRAFWRTRPIAPRTMAAAKVTLATLAFVALPLAIVCAIAYASGLPRSHWSSTVAQVTVAEGSLVGLTLVVATRTRHVPTLMLALVAIAGVTMLTFGALSNVQRILSLRGVWLTLQPDGDLALMSTRAWAGIGSLALCAIAWAGHRRRNAFAIGAGAAVLLVLASWSVPVLQVVGVARPVDIPVTMEVPAATITAERLPGPGGAVGLVARPRLGGVRPDDRTQAFLLDGTLTWADGSRPARGHRDPRSVVAGVTDGQAPLLAVLPERECTALAGRRVRAAGTLNVEVARTDLVAHVPVTAGATVTGAGARVTLHALVRSTDQRGPIAEALITTASTPGSWRRSRVGYRLRDNETGCTGTLYPWPVRGADAMWVALLPTSARPFLVQPVQFRLADTLPCRPALERSRFELVEEIHPQLRALPFDVTFTLPATAEPPRKVR